MIGLNRDGEGLREKDRESEKDREREKDREEDGFFARLQAYDIQLKILKPSAQEMQHRDRQSMTKRENRSKSTVDVFVGFAGLIS